MDEKIMEQFSEKIMNFGDSVNALNKQTNAECNHGNGIQSKACQKDFIEFFEPMIDEINKKFNLIKNTKID